jgi:hypothetical protein
VSESSDMSICGLLSQVIQHYKNPKDNVSESSDMSICGLLSQ